MSSGGSGDAILELLSPDGYYTYLGIGVPTQDSELDPDVVKKHYRRLSLRHHPDKPGGDAETFRVLNRAQRVLGDSKLRQQYNLLGIDLQDDDEDNNNGGGDDEGQSVSSNDPQHPQGVLQHIANSSLTAIIQFGVRTLMMGAVSTVLVRYRLTLYPALAFMTFIIYRILKQQSLPGASRYDVIPPFFIMAGLLLMSNAAALSETFAWTVRYWVGESLVIAMFCYNSLGGLFPSHNILVIGGITVFSILSALWFRGRVWNYAVLLIIVAILAVVVAFLFPMMELLLDVIVKEKMKKVGEKVRQQHNLLKKRYEKNQGSTK